MNLVVGATGLLGAAVCRRLAEKGKPVRALVRPTSGAGKRQALERLGVSLVQGDLKDRASLDAACQGASAVLSTASSTLSRQPGDSIQTVDLEGQINLIDAARAAKVPRFIYVSFTGNMDTDFPLRNAKRTVERHVKESGMTYTILRPSCFMEVWLSPAVGFDFANAKAQIYGSGEKEVSWISLEDVAQFAVECLDNTAAANATIELGGPEALSPLEVVRTFERATGRQFELQHVSKEALAAQREAATDPVQQSFAALMLAVADGDAIDMGPTLRKFPVKLTSVGSYARRVTGEHLRP